MLNALRSKLGRARRRLIGRQPRPEVERPTLHYGSSYGGWTFVPDRLNADAIVYSLGVGEDISFDLALIAALGLTVHAFDPTPRVVSWIQRQETPENFHFHALGVAGHDGVAGFVAPANPQHVSHRLVTDGAATSGTVALPVRRLSTLMEQLGHRRIDLLKMDIEGAEYAVVEDLLKNNLDVRQLLVEFHHRLPGVGWAATAEALRSLRAGGYRLFHVSDDANDFGFILHSERLDENE